MSGFVYNTELQEEAAGKAMPWLAIIASVIMPYAAPAIWGAIGASTGLGAALAGAVGTTAANVIGSAAVGAIAQAGIARAGGASGEEVWLAAGQGALSAGAGRLSRGLGAARTAGTVAQGAGGVPGAASTAANVGTATTQGINAIGGVGPVNLTTPIVQGSTQAGSTGGVLSGVTNWMTANPNTVQAAANALVNTMATSRQQEIAQQQLRQLEQLAAQNRITQAQKLEQARLIIQAADQSDPTQAGIRAAADAKAMSNAEFNQNMRNIAIRQGGVTRPGQKAASERAQGLGTARLATLAASRAQSEAEIRKNQLRAQAAGLLGPDQFGAQLVDAQTGLRAGAERARAENEASTAQGFANIFAPNYPKTTSPVPAGGGMQEDDDDPFYTGWSNAFSPGG